MTPTEPEVDAKNFWQNLRSFFKYLFDLREDQASERATIDEISEQTEFRGTNLWILIFAILICSIGLNVNSPAVVIGAMLISPIMGPIMGIGMGMGTNNFQLIIKALKNLAIAAGISILASALYFWISPLSDAQSELLARTSPTAWDVLIAFFGGMAGIVAGSRREKSNAIPGVAIATALMPPLCTAGFGMGTGQWDYFWGAFYLFFINCLFISIATWLFVRFLRFPKKEFVDPAREATVKRYIFVFVVLAIIPSVYTAVSVVKESYFLRQANEFVKNEMAFDSTTIINRTITYDKMEPRIELTLFGKALGQETLDLLQQQLPTYNLSNTKLSIRQSYQGREDTVDPSMIQRMAERSNAELLEELYTRNQNALHNKDQRIELLEQELLRYKRTGADITDIAREVAVIDPNITAISMSERERISVDSLKRDTITLASIDYKRPPLPKELDHLKEWLQVRTGRKNVRVVLE